MNQKSLLKTFPIFMLLSYLFAFAVFYQNKAEAASEISTNLDMLITLGEKSSNIKKTVTLENTSASSSIVSSYSIVLGAANPQNISAYSGTRKLATVQRKNGEKMEIAVDLDNEIIAAGESFSFVLEYDDDSIVYTKGSRHIAVINNFKADSGFDKVSLSIDAPSTWGGLSFSSVNYSYRDQKDTTAITITEDFSTETDIFLSYGNVETYEVNFKQTLENTEKTPVIKQVVLPPDTETQNVIWKNISDYPDSAFRDRDGNYILYYVLSPEEKKTVIFNLLIKVHSPVEEEETIQEFLGDPADYTQSDTFWGKDTLEIQGFAEQLRNSSLTNFEKAEKISGIVEEELTHIEAIAIQQAERKGAVGALRNPQEAVGEDYADLFVTIARAAGVPARSVTGFVFSAIKDADEAEDGRIHYWVEIWDNTKGWVSFDPAWSDTSGLKYQEKLGLGHAIWFKRGVSSTEPALPRLTTDQFTEKTGLSMKVFHTPLSLSTQEKAEFTVAAYGNAEIEFWETNQLLFELENTGNVALTEFEPEIESDSLLLEDYNFDLVESENSEYEQPILIPGEKKLISVDLFTNNSIESALKPKQPLKISFTAKYGDGERLVLQKYEGNINVKPLVTSETGTRLVLIVALAILLVGGFFVRYILIRRKILPNTRHKVSSLYEHR